MKSLNKENAKDGFKIFGNGKELTEDEVKKMKCKKCDEDAVYFVNNLGDEFLLCRDCGDKKKEKLESIISIGMAFIKELEFEKKGKLYYIPVIRAEFNDEHSIEGKYWAWMGIYEDLKILDCDKKKFEKHDCTSVPISFDNFIKILPQMVDLSKQTGTMVNDYYFSQDYPFDRPDTNCIYVLTNAKCGCCDDTYGKMVPLNNLILSDPEKEKEMWEKCDAFLIQPDGGRCAEK